MLHNIKIIYIFTDNGDQLNSEEHINTEQEQKLFSKMNLFYMIELS